MQILNKKYNQYSYIFMIYGGDDEIRTHAPITRSNTLAGCPLNHLSTSPSYIKHYILFGL